MIYAGSLVRERYFIYILFYIIIPGQLRSLDTPLRFLYAAQ